MAVRDPATVSSEDMTTNVLLEIIQELLEEVAQLREDVDALEE